MNEEIADSLRVLELKPGASADEVKAAYRELVKVWHPDRFEHDPKLRKRAEETLKRINSAFDRIQQSQGSADRTVDYETVAAEGRESQCDAPASPREHTVGTPEQAANTGGWASRPSWWTVLFWFGLAAGGFWFSESVREELAKYESGRYARLPKLLWVIYHLLGTNVTCFLVLLNSNLMAYFGLTHLRCSLTGRPLVVKRWRYQEWALLLLLTAVMSLLTGRL